MNNKETDAIKKTLQKLAKDLDAMPLDVQLDTSVQQELVNGIMQTVRNHQYKTAKKTGKVYSVTELTKEFSKYFDSNFTDTRAADYGTLVHRIIEELEKPGSPLSIKGKSDSVTEKQIEKQVKDLIHQLSKPGVKHNPEDLADTSIYTKQSKAEQDRMMKSLVTNVKQYLTLRDQIKLRQGGKKYTEKALGMTIKINGKNYNIAGTLDQLFSGMLMDLKTSQEIGPDYGLQLQLLRLLAMVNGINLSKDMKIISMPRQWGVKSPKDASIVDVAPMDPKVVKTILETSLKIKEGGGNAKDLRRQGRELLKMGGLKFDMTAALKTAKIDGKEVTYSVYGGKSINQWMKYINDHGAGVSGLKALMEMMSPSDRSRFKNSLFKREKGGVFKYTDSNNILNAFRYLERPELYHTLNSDDLEKLKAGEIDVSQLKFVQKSIKQLANDIGKSSMYENITSGQYDPHYLLGNFSTGDLLGLIASAKTEKTRQLLYTNIHQALKNEMVNGSISSRNDAFNFIKGLTLRSEEGGRIEKNDPKFQALEGLIGYLRLHDDPVRMALDQEKEVSFVQEMAEEALWRESHSPRSDLDELEKLNDEIDSFIGKVPSQSIKDRLQKYKPEKDATYKAQLPHRLARLLEAHRLYDATFGPIYEDHSDLFDNYDDFLETIFKGNPAMLKQYKTSLMMSKWYEEMQDKNPGMDIFQLITSPDIFGEGVIAPAAWGGFGMSGEGMNLFSLIRDIGKNNPDLLKDPKMLNEFEKQFGFRKYQWWEEHNEQARLKAMVPIDNLLHFYNRDETEKTYTETARVLGMISTQGLKEKLLARSPLSELFGRDLDPIGYEMFGKDSALFKEIRQDFETQYGKWYQETLENLDETIGFDKEQELTSRSAFLESDAGRNFLGSSTSRVNDLITRYNARNNFMKTVMEPIIRDNIDVAKQQELEEIKERHEREEAAAAQIGATDTDEITDTGVQQQIQEVAREAVAEVVEEATVEKKTKRPYIKKNMAYWESRSKKANKSIDLEGVISDSEAGAGGGPTGPGGSGSYYISGDPININHIEKATIKATNIIQNVSGNANIGGNNGYGFTGSNGGKGDLKNKEEKPLTERQQVYQERMANYYYRAYTDLDYQQHTIEKQKAREVSQAKIELYDAQLQEIKYQRELAKGQYDEYKRTHAGVNYDRVEGRQQSVLRMKTAAYDAGMREQVNLFTQFDVQMLTWLKRFVEGGAIMKLIQLARRAIQRLTNEAKQLDQSMTNLRIVTGANRDEARSMIQSYSKLADQLGVTTKEVANSANEWFNLCRDHSKINFFNCWKFLRVYITTI